MADHPLDTLRHLAAEAAEHAPGRWFWSGVSTGSGTIHLAHIGTPDQGVMQWTVMGFQRKGLHGAQPAFNDWDRHRTRPAAEMLIHEVPYRNDIVGIDHPVARWLAAADPTTVRDLIDDLNEALGLLDRFVQVGYVPALIPHDSLVEAGAALVAKHRPKEPADA